MSGPEAERDGRGGSLRKILRYSAVSAVTLPMGQVLILVFAVGLGWSALASNFLAVTLTAVPNYALNRYWVWGKGGANRWKTEILPFWVLTLLGLAVSSGLAAYADRAFDEPLLGNVANLVGFGLVWVFKFFVLDRLLFVVPLPVASVES